MTRDDLIEEICRNVTVVAHKYGTREVVTLDAYELVNYVTAREKAILDEIEKPLMQSLNYANHECMGCRAFVRKITEEALETINRLRG